MLRKLISALIAPRGDWDHASRWLHDNDAARFVKFDCWPTLQIKRRDGVTVEVRMTAHAIQMLRNQCDRALKLRVEHQLIDDLTEAQRDFLCAMLYGKWIILEAPASTTDLLEQLGLIDKSGLTRKGIYIAQEIAAKRASAA